ncbi:MAG: hypothetical protein EA409_06475 [Saprospirales bacterium]|nr:MAG: hypothetical protein EA409_06475 [Saprospirales bacterium]
MSKDLIIILVFNDLHIRQANHTEKIAQAMASSAHSKRYCIQLLIRTFYTGITTTAKFILTILAFSLTYFLSAQSVYQLPDGELVIRFSDGTERAVVPSDSILYRQAFQQINTIEKTSITEEEESVSGNPIEVDYSSIAVRMVSNRIDRLRKDLSSYRAEKQKLQADLDFARDNPGRIRPSARMELSERFNYVVEAINQTIRDIGHSKEELAYLRRLRHQDILKDLSLREVLSLQTDYNFGMAQIKNQVDKHDLKEVAEIDWSPPEDIPMPILPHPSTVYIADLYRNPPPRICNVENYSDYGVSEPLHLETHPEPLFFFLPEEMRLTLRGRPIISCNISARRKGPGLFLTFHFTLHIPSARRSFTGLPENTPIRIRLMNGEIVNLHNLRMDNGTYDERTNTVSFTAITPLSKSNEMRFRETEVDQIRVVWATGFEDYEVYDINLIRDHLKCLDKYLINQ